MCVRAARNVTVTKSVYKYFGRVDVIFRVLNIYSKVSVYSFGVVLDRHMPSRFSSSKNLRARRYFLLMKSEHLRTNNDI